MNAYDYLDFLNQFLNLADVMDNSGFGVRRISNGEYTSRESCRLELGAFLMYIANGKGRINDDDASLINIVMGTEYTGYQLTQVAATLDEPKPSSSMTMLGFISGDIALTQQNGYRTTQSTDALINLFDTFGSLMVAYDDNYISRNRFNNYIAGMKSYVNQHL